MLLRPFLPFPLPTPTLPPDRSQNHMTRQALILWENVCGLKPQQPTTEWWWAQLWWQTQSDEKAPWQRESQGDAAWRDRFVRDVWTAAYVCKKNTEGDFSLWQKKTVYTLLYGRDIFRGHKLKTVFLTTEVINGHLQSCIAEEFSCHHQRSAKLFSLYDRSAWLEIKWYLASKFRIM